jgi:S1-C subfamily serine protease
MKKSKWKNVFLVCFCVALVLSNVILLSLVLTGKKGADDIFLNNAHSVVELKAESQEIGESFGTAEFVSKEGKLITNAHVVTYTKLSVTYTFENFYIRFMDSSEYLPVTLEKYDPDLDIAVLSYVGNDHKFTPCKIGDSSKLKSGQTVYAMGNSMNYGISISQGIVAVPLVNIQYSNLTRSVIQCDLTITEGNSGGALFDERGQLVGGTTFRTKDNSGNIVYGISYCVPINAVLEYI